MKMGQKIGAVVSGLKRRRSGRTGSADLIKITTGVAFLFGISVLLIVALSIDMSRYSTLINETGKIRGGMQRLAKLELHGIHDAALEARIESQIRNAKSLNEKRLIRLKDANEFTRLLDVLEEKWQLLKDEIDQYQKGMVSSEVIIKDSEALWVTTNDFVSSIESFSHFTIALYYTIAVIGLFGLVTLFLILYILKYYVRDKIEFLARHDQLTGLNNRHYFDEVFEREHAVAGRTGRSFAILMCDIDFFKSINDRFGHAAGDTVLREIAHAVKANCRESDVLARFGGEEFVLLCIEESRAAALAFAERIRQEVQNLVILKDCRVTISIGISLFGVGKSKDQLLREADEALYKAKGNGRNRVHVHE